MSNWLVEGELDTKVDSLTDVEVSIAAGDVAITTADGPPHIEVERVGGQPVLVEVENGHLWIGYARGWGHGNEANVVLTVPPGASARLNVASASVAVSGLTGPLSIRTASGRVALDGVAGDAKVHTASGEIEGR